MKNCRADEDVAGKPAENADARQPAAEDQERTDQKEKPAETQEEFAEAAQIHDTFRYQ